MVIVHKNWRLLKAKLATKDQTNICKRVGSDKSLVILVENKKYDRDIPVFGKQKLDAFLANYKSRGKREKRDVSFSGPSLGEFPSPTKRQRKAERLRINRTQPPPQPQLQPSPPPKSKPLPQSRPPTPPRPKPRPSPQPKPQTLPRPKPQPLPKSRPEPPPQSKPEPPLLSKPEPPPRSQPQPQPPTHSKLQPSLQSKAPTPSKSKPNKPFSGLDLDGVGDSSSSPGPSRLIKKVTKKRGVNSLSTLNDSPSNASPSNASPSNDSSLNNWSLNNSTSNNSPSLDSEPGLSFWDCPTDKLVIKENILDEYRALDEESEEETEMARNIKKIKYPTPTKPAAPRPRPDPTPPKRGPAPTPKSSSPPEPKSPSKIKSDPPPPVKQVEKPREPNWPETLKKFEENQLHIVYKDLCFFKSHIMSDETAKALPRQMVTKCLQDDLAFLFLDSLKLILELNYIDGKFLSEIVQRLKRKLNINCGVMKYKSNIDPNQIRDAYKRALNQIGDYAKNENVTFTLPYYDFIFLTSSCVQPKAPNQKSSIPITQQASDTSQTQPLVDPQATQVASEHPESRVPEPKPASSVPLEHPIKTRLSPLQSQNTFNVKFFPAPDVKPKVENGNKQENTDPIIERRVTLGLNKNGEKVFLIRPMNVNRAQVFKYRL